MKKTMRLMGLCALMMLAIVSCKKENKTVTFEAKMPETSTMGKTHIGADNYLVWNSGDQIKVYTDEFTDETSAVFSTTSNNSSTATFSGTLAESSVYTAFYPAEDVTRSGDYIRYPMPAYQTYVDGDFAVNTYPMYAISAGTTFNFTSLCGLLKLSFTGTGTIGSVELSDNYFECIAGHFQYNVNNGSYYDSFTEHAITMDCGAQGLTLSDTPASMFFVVPSGYFTHGFTAVLKNLQGEEMYTLSTSQNNEIMSHWIREMPTVNIAAVGVTTGTATPNADTPSTVTLSGSYSAPMGMSVSEVGFYWGQGADLTNRQPATLENPFGYTLEGLEEGTEYSYKAYAVNGSNEFFGSVETFTTLTSIPGGAINGKFTINANGDQVYFSQGNLQYIGSAGNGSGNNAGAYWKFADNQWDYLGSSTAQDTQNLLVDRDLFSWGTSGYNYYDGYGCTNYGGYQPWCWNFNSPYCSVTSNLFDETGQADWGYNAISNGGDTENCGWRTLADDEWIYVFDTRTTSSGIRYAKANVNNVNGVILLPDDWSTSYYTLSNTNSPGAGFFSNTISASQWDTLEQHGAVFLPAAGCYLGSDGSGFASCGEQGYYWTSSYYHYSTTFSYYANNACIVVFTSNNVGPSAYQKRCYRYSVRLVRNVE